MAGALALALTATGMAGCGSDGKIVGPAGGATGSGGASNAGATGTPGGAGASMNCAAVAACGGSVVGSWKVASSCLTLSGNMDVSLLSLGCATVPVTGSITTSGTFVANADGTYTDNTKTTGSATFPLAASCLSISMVPTPCDRAASVFSAVGWTATCAETARLCSCSISVDQLGGTGMVSALSKDQLTGSYTASGNALTVGDLKYQYCAADQTLSLTPQMSALTGSVSLTRDGMVGGSGGAGGAPTGGVGAGGAVATSGAGGTSAGGGTAGGSAGAAGGSAGAAGATGSLVLPCDIYAAGNNMCVAAHSTIRALFGAYTGNLYQVKRASDGTTKDIAVLDKGGFANSSAQEMFCAATTCTITKVYDQSGHGNFVEAETPDSSVVGHSGQTAANAAQESLNVSGHKVYSLYTKPSQAYWRDGSKTDVPIGAAPQGIYIVTSGKHFNAGCCYDYGNGETSRTYVAGPSMDALYFGNSTTWGSGNGTGPWVMADLEGGVFSGPNTMKNDKLLSNTSTYVTAMEKNNGTTEMQLKAADATTGTLATYYKGALPGGKNPMKKQGAIVLGSGGDCCYSNNNASQGTFYEGAIIAGYPSDATDASVHANIVSAAYGK
ncbi:MAG: arabinofuranosidase catalytic domain-containing protein [Polyangiaceae bacterium]